MSDHQPTTNNQQPIPSPSPFHSRRVLVTGHTGFKGSWLCEWLLLLGAEVTGLALAPDTKPSLFEQLGLAQRMDSRIGDIRDRDLVRRLVHEVQPDYLFHLAAQPLVRRSYRDPLETYETNIMGTVHVLESLRDLPSPPQLLNSSTPQPLNLSTLQPQNPSTPTSAVFITTDKCYHNREWVHSYREDDPMGGHDPYSASKGCAELVIDSYRRSFFCSPSSTVGIASARAGNVIGGGDWAEDRILPDCARALSRGEDIHVRNRHATRPWQHVLEPLGGYLHLAATLHRATEQSLHEQAGPVSPDQLFSAYNFGPGLEANRSVGNLVEEVLRHWPGQWTDHTEPDAPHEASLLNLATDKAYHHLGWKSRWDFATTVEKTITWYRQILQENQDPTILTRTQIQEYQTTSLSP